MTIETVKKYYPQAACFLGGILFAVLVPILGKNPQVADQTRRAQEAERAAQSRVEPAPAAPAAKVDSPSPYALRALDANLYMQLSAEYRAACLQAYRFATDRLVQRVKDALDIEHKADPSAVVMDLDETVLDNAAYQSYLLRNRLAYAAETWDRFEAGGGGDVKLIPGTGPFIQRAQGLGLKVFYITNRTQKNKAQTLAVLKALGIGVPDDQLLCAESETSSDKTGRREQVKKGHNVLLYLGDQLRDFDEKFKSAADKTKTTADIAAAMKQRRDKVDEDAKKWGDLYIVFPNPSYGEYTKGLGNGDRDLELLVPSAKIGK